MTDRPSALRLPSLAGPGLDVLTCDEAAGRLSTPTDSVNVGTRGARLMRLLLNRRGQIVALPDLMEAGWPGFSIEESSLAVEIASLRRALLRLLGGVNWIIGVPRRGYRLVTTPAAARLRSPGQWEPPTIAVLPFSVAEPTQSAEATALTATLTATLGLHAGLSVMPRHMAVFVAGLRAAAARDLGARYLLDGFLQSEPDRSRLTLTLTDTVEGRIIWTRRFDHSGPSPIDRQDRLAAEAVQALDVLLVRGEEAEIGYPPTRNLAAWTHYVRGIGHAYWPRHDMDWGGEILLAIGEWEKALALDPESPQLLATVGAGYAALSAYPSLFEVTESATEAARHLRAALDRDPDNPIALAFHALILTEADHFEVATEVARRAIRLAPHAPAVTAMAAVALCAAGATTEAVAAVERTLAATPHFPAIYNPPLARAWRSIGRVDEAIRFLEALADEPHKFDGRELVLAYVQAGRHEDAVNAATQLLMMEPGFSVTGWLATQHRRDHAAIARDADALRAVGLPD